MKDPKKVHDKIIEELDLATVMEEYNVSFKHNPHLAAEVQFHCPFHGPDNKPSARLYNTTKTCFCWVCRKTWNVISFIMEKEGMYYKQALNYIPNRFHIDLSSIPDDPTLEFPKITVSDIVISMKCIKSNLLDLRKKIPFEKYKTLCGVLLLLKYEDHKGSDITSGLNKLEDKILCLKQSL